MNNYNTRKSIFVKNFENNNLKSNKRKFLEFTSSINDVKIVEQKEINNHILLNAISTKTSCRCQNCNEQSYKIKDTKIVYPHIGVYNDKPIIMKFTKKRFKCSICLQTFVEPTPTVEYRKQISNTVNERILPKIKNGLTYTQCAKVLGVSISHILRYFDKHDVEFTRYTKVENILIDELRLIFNKRVFQAVIIDADTKEILDILPTRNQKDIFEYLNYHFEIGELKTVTMDLWNPYRNAVSKFNQVNDRDVKIIADKFHYVRQMMWDLDTIRINEYERYEQDYQKRKILKSSARVFRKRKSNLSSNAQNRLRKIFEVSPIMYVAYQFKESYLEIIQTANSADQFNSEIESWFEILMNSGNRLFKRTVTSHSNWQEEIANSFDYKYSNGYIEGCNQKMKLAKNKAFGFSNIDRTKRLMQLVVGNREMRLVS